MDKIEFIDIDGQQFPISMFPDNVKQQVTTFEIARQQYNESAVTTAALGDYMRNLTVTIQSMAKEAIENLAKPKQPAVAPVDGAEDK